MKLLTVRRPVWCELLSSALALAEERPWIKDVLAARTFTPTLKPGGRC